MIRRKSFLVLATGLWALCSLHAGETADGKSQASTETTTEEEPKNWIELGIGGVIVHGDAAQFEQEHRLPDAVYGGITDLHFEQSVGKDGQLVVDGHALFDFNDYDLRIELSKPKVGYIRAGFTEFRSWYDGNGGFFPPHGGTWFRPTFPEMHIDRGEAWVELGLRVPDWPEITLRYSHEFRDGQKDSTTWGDTNLTGEPIGLTRKIIPSFRNIDEKRDIFSLDISKTIGNTDILLGMRYEHIDDQDSLNMIRGAGQLPPVVRPPGSERFVTQHLNDDIDVFNGHAITETRFSDSLWFTAGYSYTTLENDLSGSRIFGTHFDSAFGEPVPTLGQRDHAFIDLNGVAEVKYHIVNANIFWTPLPNLNIISGFRYTHESQDNVATFLALEPTPNIPPPGFHFGPPEPVSGEKMSDYDRFAQRIDLRYTGITDWLFYAEAEWEEEHGHVFEVQENEEAPVDKDTHFLGQKYVLGATWYPTTRLNVATQYYHKVANYDNDIFTGPAQRLVGQDWDTDNVNIRVTWRPKIPANLGMLALTSRYDFVHTNIDGQWAIDAQALREEQTGEIIKHAFTESITWNPLARLYMQTDVSVVLNQTETPASKINLTPFTSPTVLNFRNDYATLTAAVGYIINDKTDIRADYSFYRANDYAKNSRVGLPYGMGATENTASVTASREIMKNMRLLVKYTYFDYDDVTSGHHNNYQAHSIYSGLQIRF